MTILFLEKDRKKSLFIKGEKILFYLKSHKIAHLKYDNENFKIVFETREEAKNCLIEMLYQENNANPIIIENLVEILLHNELTH